MLENYQMVRNALLAETVQSQQGVEQESEILRQFHRRSRDYGAHGALCGVIIEFQKAVVEIRANLRDTR